MKKKTVEYGKYGYLFILPFFLVYFLFQLYPLIYTVYLSFVEYYQVKLGKFQGPNFNGFKNYVMVLAKTKNTADGLEVIKWFDNMVIKAIGNTIKIWVLNFIPQILLALLLASWFTDTVVKLKGQGAFKVMMFMPNIITASSIAVLFYSLFSANGPIAIFLRDVHIIKPDYDFMERPGGTIGLIAFMQFWMWYGNSMIVLIAGILGINPSLYEAAMVDGASSKQQFFNITLPLLKPIIQFSLVTSAIGGLQMYDIPSLFNVDASFNGMPNYASETITMWIKTLGFTSKDYGKAAAASMVLFLVTMVISLVFFTLTKEREPKQKHAVIR
ncbi:MAG: carbohydrate ABC transporter permease [Wujia sp.]